MSAAAAAFPNWVLLERFVFRRDDDDDESFQQASIRVSGTTSWNAPFRVGLDLAEPPRISRFYAQLPGFPDPREQTPLHIIGTHRHLLLFRVGMETPERALKQDLFVYSAQASEIRRLPPCMEPRMDRTRRDGRPRRRTQASALAEPRLLATRSMGLICGGNEQEGEFAVAELTLFQPKPSEVYADICLLLAAGPGDHGEWKSMRVLVHGEGILEGTWQTTAVIPFRHWLCFIDYHRGILFCEVFKEPTPTVSFLEFPTLLGSVSDDRKTCRPLYRGVSVVSNGSVLKFVDVVRPDGIGYGELKPHAGFTVTCHTLQMSGSSSSSSSSMEWEQDYMVTSQDLWSTNPIEYLPHDILLYPQVNIDRPHVVHFLISEFKPVMKRMWVVTINMNTRIVESFYPYLHGEEALGTQDAGFTRHKSRSLMPYSFLPCEFSKFLHSSRKRKDME